MNKKKLLMIFSIFGLIFFICGCSSDSVTILDYTNSTKEGFESVVLANNNFAFDLYLKLKESTDRNVFFSPYSIHTAMSMTYEGANGSTKKEMENVLRLSANESLRYDFAKMYNTINNKSDNYELSTANALWGQKDYVFLEEFLSASKNYYGANITNLEFRDSKGSSEVINKWVEEQTNGKIMNLVPESAISPYTKLILTNAIYFKGSWDVEFDERNTKKRDFKKSLDDTIQVDMMYKGGDEDDEYNYFEDDDIQALEIPYKGDKLSMIIILPKENDIGGIEDKLTNSFVNEIKSGFSKVPVNIYLPKFKFETKYFMKEVLSNMGMSIAFEPSLADFSGMNGEKRLFISDVIHQAFVDVNEKGTEAAAVTAVVMMDNKASAGPRIYTFNANHPFIFFIQEKSSGEILFLGKVENPNE